MDPIINPLWFYLIHIINGAGNAFTFVAVLGGITTICLLMFVAFDAMDPFPTEATKHWTDKAFNGAKIAIIVTLIGLIFTAIIPDKQTCYAMMAANVITPNNLTTVKDSGQDIIDYIIEASEKLSKEEKDK